MRLFKGLGSMNLSTRCYLTQLIFSYLLIILLSGSSFVSGLLTITIDQPKIYWKVCVVRSPHMDKSINEFCPNMYEGHIECVIVYDRADCVRKLISGKVDFAALKPEDLQASQKFLEDRILVTHELRLFEKKKASVDMVALVNENIRSLAELKGKRFCHPGFDSASEDWTPILSNYFQNQLIPIKCDPDRTLLENRIASLSEYFEAGCLAGSWTNDDTIDRHLQTTYRNLCALCDDPSGCYSSDKYHGRTGALLCLTENTGDIAWVQLDAALYHFKLEGVNRSMYNYLCPDGSLRTADGGVPCPWISKPSPVIVARRESAQDIARVIDSVKHHRCLWQPELMELLTVQNVNPVLFEPLKTPEDFLRDFPAFTTAESGVTCQPSRSIKWCVSSNLEEKKCSRLRDTAFAHGIEPTIACHEKQSRQKSIRAVATGTCDFFIAQPEDFKMASEESLTSILEIFPRKNENINKIGIVVKEDSKFHSLGDLLGSTVCLTGFKSIAWHAFTQVMMHKTNNTLWKCSSEAAMSKYFKSHIYPNSNQEDIDKISSTYDCLVNGTGDVAIVNLRDKDFMSQEKLRTICAAGVNKPGCFLTWTTLGSVMVSSTMPEVRRNEIRLMVQDLNAYFGTSLSGREAALSLYGPFEAHDDVIFPSESYSMWRDADHVGLERKYRDILSDNYTHSIICSSAGTFSFNGAIVSTILIFLFITFY